MELLLLTLPLWTPHCNSMPHLVCASLCTCSSESHQALSGISVQLCLPWNSLSSTLTCDLFTQPCYFFFFPCIPLFTQYIRTHTRTDADCRESPDEMRQAVSFKWPWKQNCCWVINEKNTRWHHRPLTFFLSYSPSLTQHQWSHNVCLLTSLHINLLISITCW